MMFNQTNQRIEEKKNKKLAKTKNVPKRVPANVIYYRQSKIMLNEF